MSFIKKLALTTGLLMMSSCSSLFYYPSAKQLYHNPKSINLELENIEMKSEAGERLHGWWFNSKTQPAKGTIVFFHGNAQNISAHYLYLIWVIDHGYNFFIFDYPGYGLSEGKPTPKNTVASGRTALRWVFQNKTQSPLIVYGQSLGGAISMKVLEELKSEIPIRAYVADSTFRSYVQVGKQKLGSWWLSWPLQPLAYVLLSDRYAAKSLGNLSPTPVLVTHQQDDEVVDKNFGEILFSEAKDPKTQWKVAGAHTALYYKELLPYREKLIQWLESLP